MCQKTYSLSLSLRMEIIFSKISLLKGHIFDFSILQEVSFEKSTNKIDKQQFELSFH